MGWGGGGGGLRNWGRKRWPGGHQPTATGAGRLAPSRMRLDRAPWLTRPPVLPSTITTTNKHACAQMKNKGNYVISLRCWGGGGAATCPHLPRPPSPTPCRRQAIPCQKMIEIDQK